MYTRALFGKIGRPSRERPGWPAGPVARRQAMVVAILAGLAAGTGAGAQQAPVEPAAPAGLPRTAVARCERDLAMLKHLERHLRSPWDGRALLADLGDLRRMTRPLSPPSPVTEGPLDQATGDELAENVAILMDLWNARLNDRTPFPVLVPPRVQALDRAQQSVTVLGARLSPPEREHLIPRLHAAIDAMLRYGQGAGPIPESAIDNALAVASAALTGRPAQAPAGPYPPGPVPRQARPDDRPPAPPRPDEPPTPPVPPAPGGGQPATAYPADLAAYAGTPNLPCAVDRGRAAEAGDSSIMLRAAECWARPPATPLWGNQTIEALAWASDLASIARNCESLHEVILQLRRIGPPARIASSDAQFLDRLVQEVEWQRVWLRCQK